MYDPWLESWLECQRIAERNVWRAQLWLKQRQLRQQERLLGELGWQQAHFDTRDTTASGLLEAEKQQARIVFDLAEIKEQIAELKTEADAKTAKLQSAVDLTEATANQREAHALGLLNALEIERQRGGPIYLIESLQKSIAEDEIQLRQARAQHHSQRERLDEHQKETQHTLDTKQRSLEQLEGQLRALDRSKNSHFAKIGHDLADVGIAPMNQPEILTRVLELRQKISDWEGLLAASLAVSWDAKRSIRVTALGLWGLLILAVSLLAFLFCSALFAFLIRK